MQIIIKKKKNKYSERQIVFHDFIYIVTDVNFLFLWIWFCLGVEKQFMKSKKFKNKLILVYKFFGSW